MDIVHTVRKLNKVVLKGPPPLFKIKKNLRILGVLKRFDQYNSKFFISNGLPMPEKL